MKEGNRKLLLEGAKQLGVDLTAPMVRAIERHSALLEEWGRAIALTAIREEREVVLKHVLDSLSVVPHLPATARVVDIGSGPGFPGIPVKVTRPDLEVVLLEPNRKKIAFLKAVVRELELPGIGVLGARAEEAARDPGVAGSFDLALARAFGPIEKLLLAASPLVRIGGELVSMLGPRTAADLRTLSAPRGWTLIRRMNLGLPAGAGDRHLFFFSRTA